MNIIVAVDKNWAIGKDNKLLVSIPADMKMFRQEQLEKLLLWDVRLWKVFQMGCLLRTEQILS